MIILMKLAGFLFLFILILNPFVLTAFGYIVEIGDYNSEAELQKINNKPKRWKISIVVALIEHSAVVALPIMLFIVFSPLNLLLGIVWTTVRIGEGVIQFYNEKSYWGFRNLASQYAGTIGVEKNALIDSGRSILQTKDYRFKFAMFLWAIGTLAFSILLVTYGVGPAFIGWLGIVASILVGIFNGIKLVKPNFKGGPLAIGGLSAIVFEVLIGGWLLFYA